MNGSSLRLRLGSLLLLAALLAAWEAGSRFFGLSALVLPAPSWIR